MRNFILPLVMVVVLAVGASAAFADVIPSNHHYMQREYVLTGLDGHAGYTFILVGEKKRRGDQVELATKRIANNLEFESFRAHWSYSLKLTLVAVKGNVPDNITADWLKGAEKLTLAADEAFAGGGYVQDSNPAHKTRTYYSVEIVRGTADDATPQLKLTQTRQITYNQAGTVLNDSAANRDDNGNGNGDSDGDGLPADVHAIAATGTPVGLMLALAFVAAIGLVFGLVALGRRE